MNRGMIRGVEMRVDMASEDNGFVELPEEAADQPWAKIGESCSILDCSYFHIESICC